MANETPQYNPPNFDNYKQSFSENGFQSHEDGEPIFAEDAQEGVHPTENGADEGDAATPRKKKNANPYNKRIDRLTAEKGEFEQHAHFLAQQLAERDAIIAAQREKEQDLLVELSHKSKYADNAFEHNLHNLESSLIDKIEQAELEGDIRKKTELSRDLAKVVAQQSTYELYKSQQQQQQQTQLYNEPYVPYETPIVQPLPQRAPVNDDFLEWKENNPWYDSDQNLKKEADEIADDLARRLRFNNQDHLIGTNDFRQSVTNIMRDRYGLSDDHQEAEETHESHFTPTYQTRPAAVAPVQRRGPSMADQYVHNRGNGPQRMSPLTKEEYNLARYLPQKHKSESEADLIARYAKGKAYPKSPLPGGTPHRLTIL